MTSVKELKQKFEKAQKEQQERTSYVPSGGVPVHLSQQTIIKPIQIKRETVITTPKQVISPVKKIQETHVSANKSFLDQLNKKLERRSFAIATEPIVRAKKEGNFEEKENAKELSMQQILENAPSVGEQRQTQTKCRHGVDEHISKELSVVDSVASEVDVECSFVDVVKNGFDKMFKKKVEGQAIQQGNNKYTAISKKSQRQTTLKITSSDRVDYLINKLFGNTEVQAVKDISISSKENTIPVNSSKFQIQTSKSNMHALENATQKTSQQSQIMAELSQKVKKINAAMDEEARTTMPSEIARQGRTPSNIPSSSSANMAENSNSRVEKSKTPGKKTKKTLEKFDEA